MALRDQPYFPLYVKDFLSDEKLANCSAESTGVYIRLMCLMHKSEHYGKILLRQKWRQSDRQVSNFAVMLARQMPYDLPTIERSIDELLDENVIYIDGDYLCQKRMIKDAALSETRAKSGKKGAEKSNKRVAAANNFAVDFAAGKSTANSAIAIAIENANENEDSFLKCDNQNELGTVMSLYFDRVQAAPSQTCIDELKSYVESLSGPVVIHAINIAIDNGKANWSYIRGILQSYHRNGLNSLDAVQKAEHEYQERKTQETRARGRPEPKKSLTFWDVYQDMVERGEG